MSISLATRKHSNHARVERVLVEAIEAVVTPNIAAKLLTGALRAALLSAVPTDRAELTRFVKGQLFDSLAGMLGDDEAGIVVEGLMPILPRVSDPSEHSQIRATTRPARSDEFTRPEVGEPLGVAIIASAHPTRRSGLLHDLGSDCVALHADDLMALFDQVHASAFAHPVLVLDCLSPSVNPISVATLVPDLPQGSSIVLWGASAALEAEVVALGQGQGRFIRCEGNVSPGDVASLVRALLGN
ncbi:MAG: hypothetical protein H6725_09800 [Sandaracinaceae bacterium]|nr:hypothetical protein [Sandaracinaceae bacterium]